MSEGFEYFEFKNAMFDKVKFHSVVSFPIMLSNYAKLIEEESNSTFETFKLPH